MKMHTRWTLVVLVLLSITSLQANELSKVWSQSGSPFDSLPANMERLTTFGWRPNLSPDGRTLIFVSKEFGDVFTMDLVTRQLYCLTDTICPEFPQHDSFIRASHLPNGDYLLVGISEWAKPKTGEGAMPLYSATRHEECRMYYLSKKPRSIPVPFGPSVVLYYTV